MLIRGIDTDGAFSAGTIDADGYLETTWEQNKTVATTYRSLDYVTSGCATTLDSGWKSAQTTLLVGGVTASSKGCLEWAIDGFLVTGFATVLQFDGDFAVSLTGPKPVDANSVWLQSMYTYNAVAGQTGTIFNVGGVTQVTAEVQKDLLGSNLVYLLSGRELYGPSYLVAIKQNDFTTTSAK